MFKVKLIETPAHPGLAWAVIKVNYAGNGRTFAFCKTQKDAVAVRDALNAAAVVTACETD